MEECVFCKIVLGDLKSNKVWEDDYFLAFLDANPVGEGHTLVIPKKHFETFIDLDLETGRKYIEAIQKVGKLLMEKYDSDGFNIILNNGKSAGQVVGHVHFHLLPRKEGDGKRGIYVG
jgi:histidine triad (HIT) family protein